MPRIEINGAQLAYQDVGSGSETIVFSHGLLWSSAMWQFQLEVFKSGYRCIAFDFRGQGQSEVTASGYDMETLALDAAGLIEKLALAPVHFVGLSMGGFIGMRLAARRPELLRSLTLIETAADAEPTANVPKYKLLGLVARLFGVRLLVGKILRILFGRSFLADPARAALREEMRQRLLRADVTGMIRALGGVITRLPVEGELGKIRMPVLVLSGEQDTAVVPARSRRLADAIAGAKFTLIPRAGHTSSIEEPEEVNRALREFLRSR